MNTMPNKPPTREQRRAYYARHRDLVLALNQAYRERNRDKYNAYMRNYRAKRREDEGRALHARPSELER